MRALRSAALLLLSLAAASCAVDTDSLKPKTEAQCAAEGKKACGSKCMDFGVATGCGNPGCEPCPAVPTGNEAFCDAQSPSQCASRPPCPAGSAYCDGPTDTVCDDLVSSGANCGACGHYCGGAACSNWMCATGTIQPVGTNPADLAYDGTSLFLVLNNSPAAGQVSLWQDGAPVLTWTGRANRVEADTSGAVVWSTLTGDSIWEYRAGDVVPTLLFAPTSAPRNMALDPSYAYFSELGSTATHESAVDLVEVKRAPNAQPGHFLAQTFTGDVGIGGVALENPASSSSRAIVGTDNGALRWVSWDLSQTGTYATSIEPPISLVVYTGLVGAGSTAIQSVAFWLAASGNLYAKVLPSGPVVHIVSWTFPSNAGAAGLDLHADAGGVYWVDAGFQGANVNSTFSGTYGLVGEWRAAHDDTVVLYLSPTGRPSRVTTRADEVLWIDASNGSVLSVAK